MTLHQQEVIKVTEWKSGRVYKTKKIKTIWIPMSGLTTVQTNEIAKKYGGDFLASMSTNYTKNTPYDQQFKEVAPENAENICEELNA